MVRPDGGSPDSHRSARTREAATVRLPQRRLRLCIRKPASPPRGCRFSRWRAKRVFRRRPSVDRSPSAAAVAELRFNGFRPLPTDSFCWSGSRDCALLRRPVSGGESLPPSPPLQPHRLAHVVRLHHKRGDEGGEAVASAAWRSLSGRSTTTSSRSGNRYHSWVELLGQELRPASHAGAESAGSGHPGAVGVVAAPSRTGPRTWLWSSDAHPSDRHRHRDDHILLLDQDTDGPQSLVTTRREG